MKLLRRTYFVLLYILPAILFFSYYPVIRLGSDASMNFELSLPLIWLVIFDVIAFVSLMLFGAPSKKGISDRKFFLFALFPFYATISIFWSANPTRAILTAGIIWLLFFAVFAIIYVSPLLNPPRNFRIILLKSFFASSVLVCLFCWAQCILDVCSVTREHTLLCLGCVSQTFGFPHPSGFAIEPQFMGNLLLAPALTALYFLVFHRKPLPRRQRRALIVCASLFIATLFLTFSRGAIYAFAIGLTILLIFALVKHQFRLTIILIPVTAFIFTLVAQGIFTVIGPTHGSFISGVAKSIHQLSLGIIDFRPTSTPTEVNPDSGSQDQSNTSSTPTFDGYIAESTNIRLSLNSAALDTWLSAPGHYESNIIIGLKCSGDGPCNATAPLTPTSVFFGVGLGGAGTALATNSFITGITSSKEIVQNQPISLLLELGLVGIILVIFSLILAFYPQIFPRRFIDGRAANQSPAPSFWQHPVLPLLVSLIIAYIVTLQFFSGLPNALQIYLLPPLLYFTLHGPEKTIALPK